MNNKGFAKHELVIVIVLLLIIFAFLFNNILGGASHQKIETMKENALNFQKTVSTNIASFRNVDVVYLEEAIDASILPAIKNPFGGGYCDSSQSKVTYSNGKPYSTLKCGKYLIDKASFLDKETVNIYKVSEWTTDKKKNSNNLESKKLYNCIKNGKEVYTQYYEDLYLVSKIDKDFNTNYFFIKDIDKDTCKVVGKTFYRTKELVKQ